jgi:DNA-binding NarL/FixJ family response regulator
MLCQSRKTIGIYVIEEQEFYRDIYQVSFQTDNSFNFIGASSDNNGEYLQKVLVNEKPDVLLLGAKNLDTDTLQELEHLFTTHPNTKPMILVTSVATEEAKLLRKLIQKCRHGIAIYMKQSLDNGKQLHDIIRSVARGQVVLDPAVANLIFMERTEYPFMKLLTERELEILNLLSQGYTNHGIAQALCIDVKTVAHHLNNIYGKLKEDSELNQKHPRVSVARLYLETT